MPDRHALHLHPALPQHFQCKIRQTQVHWNFLSFILTMSRQITIQQPRIAKSSYKFTARRVEFIFFQTAPVVCLPYEQTDFVTLIITFFRVLLYRAVSKSCSKSKICSIKIFMLAIAWLLLQHLLDKDSITLGRVTYQDMGKLRIPTQS